MEPRGLPSLLPVDTLHWAERLVRRLASPQREAVCDPLGDPTEPQRTLACEQRAQCRHDGGVVLEDAQSPAKPVSRLRCIRTLQGAAPAFQKDRLQHRLLHHHPSCQLYGLGQAPAAQSGGQAALVPEPANLPAVLCRN